MSDPIEKLSSFGSEFEGGTMPLPAADVRRRGDRIRRRRHGVIAAGVALAVTAVAVPVFALGGLGGSESPDDLAPQPTVSDPTSAPLSQQNLLSDADAVYPNGGADWRPRDTFPGDGQDVFNPCTQESFGGLGSESTFRREFEFVSTDSGDVEPTLSFNEIIGEFADEDAARDAYETIQGWFADCQPPGAEEFNGNTFEPVDVPGDGEAVQMVATYGPVDKTLDPYGDEVWFLDTGLVLDGDRIAVLSQLTHGQDYNWPDGGTPVQQMLPAAAERLTDGPPDLGADQLPSSDDAVFFSGSDFVEDSTTHGEGENPNPCLTQSLADRGAADTWRRDFVLDPPLPGPGGESLVTTVSEFPSVSEAEDAYDAIFAEVDACADHLGDTLDQFEPGTFNVERTSEVDLGGLDGQGKDVTDSYVTPDVPDAAHILDTGVVQIGNRLLLATQQFIGQDFGPETVATTLANAAPRLLGAPASPGDTGASGGTDASGVDASTLTPDGVGDLTLGMTSAEADAATVTGTVVAPTGKDCGALSIGKPRRNSVDGYIEPDDRVSIIYARRGMTTPEGVGIGDTRADVEAAYPDVEEVNGFLTVTPEGYDDRSYTFFVEADGTVSGISIGFDEDNGACVN